MFHKQPPSCFFQCSFAKLLSMFKRFKRPISVVGVLVLLYSVYSLYGMRRRHHDVIEICDVLVGSSIKPTMARAMELGFSWEKQGALGRGIQITSAADTTINFDKHRSIEGIKDGKVRYGKTSLPPFMRHYCELIFKDEVITSKRLITID